MKLVKTSNNLSENEEQAGVTVTSLRAYPECENLSDQEASLIVFTLKELAAIFYDLRIQENLHNIDNQSDERIHNPQKRAA